MSASWSLAATIKRVPSLFRFISTPSHFELPPQDPVEQGQQSQCRSNQDNRVKPEHSDVHSQVALFRPEKYVRLPAPPIIALLHFGIRDQVGNLLVHVDLLGRHSARCVSKEGAIEPSLAVQDLIDAPKIPIQ